MIHASTKEAVEIAVGILTESLDEVASSYGCNGDHDSMIVANAFDDLGEKIKQKVAKL